MAPSYTHITSPSELSSLTTKNSVVVLDFHATWCGPCKTIAPVFDSLATKHASASKVAFAKVDVDAAQAVAQLHNVRAMPTFIILSGTREVARIQGADRAALTTAIERHAAAARAKPAYSGAGHRLSSSSSSSSSPSPAIAAKSAKSAAPYIRDGRVGVAPLALRLRACVDVVVAFVALYLVSLFSIDAVASAETSGFAVGGGRGGGGGGGGGPPGGPPGRRLGTVDNVRRGG